MTVNRSSPPSQPEHVLRRRLAEANVVRAVGRLLGAETERGPWPSVVGSALFCLALIVVHGRHELWRDELHCWMVGRDAHGLWDVLTGVRRYDGHPFLWYYLLHLVSRLSRSVVLLHGITILLATTSSYLWLRHAPLPRGLRVGLLGSYLFFYEYSVLSRSYALGLLCLFLFCRLYGRDSRRVPLLSVVLVALALTSAYGAMIAVALAVVPYLHGLVEIFKAKESRSCRIQHAAYVTVGMVVFALGLELFWYTSLPPEDGWFGTPGLMRTSPPLSKLALYYWSANFPRCNPGNGAWMVKAAMGDDIPALLPWLPWAGFGLFALWLLALRRAVLVAVAYGLGVIAIAGFQHYYYEGFVRHFGHYFVLLIACVWLYGKERAYDPGTKPAWLLRGLLSVTVVFQAFTAVKAVEAESALPFSGSVQAATFLRERGLDDGPLVGSFDHAASVVPGYLDRPFWAAEANELVTSVVFHTRRWRRAPLPMVLGIAAREARSARRPAIVLLNYPIDLPRVAGLLVERLYVTDTPIVADERFTILRITPTGSATNPKIKVLLEKQGGTP